MIVAAFLLSLVGLGFAWAAWQRSRQLEEDVRLLEGWRLEVLQQRTVVAPPVAPVTAPVAAPAEAPDTQSPTTGPAQPPPLPPRTLTLRPASCPPGPKVPPATRVPVQAQVAVPAPAPVERVREGLGLEQFVGAKLFAWMGGLALFFAAALGMKYSFDHGLVPAWLRAFGGYVLGAGLLFGGTRLDRSRYPHTVSSLWGAGIVILYAVTYACQVILALPWFTREVTFAVLGSITALAFLLAMRLDAPVVAVLGIVAGFLTPVLLSTGTDHGIALFGYVAVLDVGLLAVAWRRRWPLLPLLGAVGTVLTQAGWYLARFDAGKIGLLEMQLSFFPLLFGSGLAWVNRKETKGRLWTWSAVLPAVTSLLITLLLVRSPEETANPPLNWCVGWFVSGVVLTWIAWLREDGRWAEVVGGCLGHAVLWIWVMGRMTPEVMGWGLGLILVHAGLHSVNPVAWGFWRGFRTMPWTRWGQLSPALGLLLALVYLVREIPIGPAYWLVLLCLDAVALALAVLVGGWIGLALVLFLSMGAAALWLQLPQVHGIELAESLVVIGGFAAFFIGASSWLELRNRRGRGALEVPDPGRWMPSLSALLPFALLVMVVARIRPSDPSGVFLLATGLVAMLLVLHRWQRIRILPALGLVGLGMVEWVWLRLVPQENPGWVPLAWVLGVFAFLLVQAKLMRVPLDGGRVAWWVAGLSGPVQFLLFQWVVRRHWEPWIPGLLPLPFLALQAGLLEWVRRTSAVGAPGRRGVLAWLAGGCLFLATAVLPLQFREQWLTVGFALEGVALFALFHRLPHPGLRKAGLLLLGWAVGRLCTDPILFGHAPRPESGWNGFLYAHLAVIACLWAGARLLAAPRDVLSGIRLPPVLAGIATLLGFLLLNLEIAIVFGDGPTLDWAFSGNLSRDLAYSIGWSVFAFGLLLVGLLRRQPVPRHAGLALLGLTLLKLFLHDLSRLESLHRIGAFAAVSVVAMVASYLYQRFLGTNPTTDSAATGTR